MQAMLIFYVLGAATAHISERMKVIMVSLEMGGTLLPEGTPRLSPITYIVPWRSA